MTFSARIIAVLATMPDRPDQLDKTVRSLESQVHGFHIYLNGHIAIPESLVGLITRMRVRYGTDCVELDWSRDHGDLEAAGKWFRDPGENAYVLACDDDIVYPPNYAAKMIHAVERYNRQAMVGVLGVRLRPTPVAGYYRHREVFPVRHPLRADTRCHLVGTGCAAYHTSTIHFTPDDFPIPGMADIWAGVKCKAEDVPVYAVERPAEWLKPLEVYTKSIYGEYKRTRDDSKQAAVINANAPWPRF